MREDPLKKRLAVECLTFKQGQDNLFDATDGVDEGLQKISSKLSDLANIKNLHFLLGAGASSDSIPAMAQLLSIVEERVNDEDTKDKLSRLSSELSHAELNERYATIKNSASDNLENILGTLYSKRAYLKGVGETDQLNDFLVQLIEQEIYSSIVTTHPVKKVLDNISPLLFVLARLSLQHTVSGPESRSEKESQRLSHIARRRTRIGLQRHSERP